MEEKTKIITKIIDRLNKENILWFIVEEVEDSLDYLNKYKLKNIENNLDSFILNLKKVNENYVNSL